MKKFETQLQNIRWVDLTTPKKSDLNHLSQELNIPNRVLLNALNPEHLPKYELLESAAVIYLRTIDYSKTDAANIQDLTTKITLLISNDSLITIHRMDHPFLEELRHEAVEKNYTLKDVIKSIITSSMMTFDAPLSALENRVEIFEESIFETSKSDNIVREGYFLKRKASAIRKVLKFSLDILASLQSRPDFVWRDFQGLRESIERNLFYTEDVLENVTGLLNLHISLSAQKTNEVMRVLTVFSIFFLPLNFLAGVYGMNFDYMPELHHEKGYFLVLGSMAAISIGIFIWVYRRGWLKRPN
ncbi:magnesium and cobalt transport protein [Bacteriovorax stolpii]|uniref:Magnesium and cobalt transport protein n=1 Tax=Bacteriovorax stolpii TaxID=960 RepID=A0A2K9NVT3_BACTC|nr:CorA family divalent cation transporter [Bacteriovorax stolpii]AUN99610.1 magnesium and cobalt transport protein [Bacteriovorax stolpii]QDK40395.1 magnesium and cobalt transport protein [Bacteriovorax stolpii]TDP51240.1 magnesium transporter [Bacteriovorax stolpii]